MTSIDHFLIHFTQADLHRLASDSINKDVIFDTNSNDMIVPDVLSALRRSTLDLLIDACTRTTNLLRIRILVDHLTFSWKDNTGNTIRICNNKKLDDCLKLAVSSGTKMFVLYTHCDALYFAPDFDGLNLDRVDTTAFPTSPPATPVPVPQVPPTPVAAHTTLLSTAPTTAIFN
jgi:hypothetical protein